MPPASGKDAYNLMHPSRLAGSLLTAFVISALPLLNLSDMTHTASPVAVAAAESQSVDVLASDFKFEPRAFTVAAGSASFSVRNDGVIEHDFVILDAQRQRLAGTEPLAPGASGVFEATLAPGTYVITCTLPGHREVGMTGELSVTP